MIKATKQEIQNDFRLYCQYILEDMIPDFVFQPFHKVIIDHIHKVINREIPPKLGVFLPPRHGKTLFLADMFLTFMFGRYPHRIGAYGTYNEEFAQERRDAFEKIVTMKRYEALFPTTRIKTRLEESTKKRIKALKSVKNVAYEIHNALSPRGKVVFVGRGNKLTGIGLHYSTCDDLYKNAEEALSEKVNDSIFEWFIKVWRTRLEVNSIQMLCYTRWADDDVAGRLLADDALANETNRSGYIPWRFLRFPAYKDDVDDNPYDLRQFGEMLDPAREPQYADAQINDSTYLSLYQQQPMGASDLYLFKDVVFPRYTVLPPLAYKIISIDTTFKGTSKTVDRTAFTVWGIQGQNIFMFPNFVNKKMNFSELKQTLIQMVCLVPDYFLVLVEDSANGPALFSELEQTVPKMVLWGVRGKSKRERGQYCYPYANSGRIHLPCPHTFPAQRTVDAQIGKFTGLNKNEIDDICDTMFQAVQYYDQAGVFRVWGLPAPVRNPMFENKAVRGLLPASKVRALYV